MISTSSIYGMRVNHNCLPCLLNRCTLSVEHHILFCNPLYLWKCKIINQSIIVWLATGYQAISLCQMCVRARTYSHVHMWKWDMGVKVRKTKSFCSTVSAVSHMWLFLPLLEWKRILKCFAYCRVSLQKDEYQICTLQNVYF